MKKMFIRLMLKIEILSYPALKTKLNVSHRCYIDRNRSLGRGELCRVKYPSSNSSSQYACCKERRTLQIELCYIIPWQNVSYK